MEGIIISVLKTIRNDLKLLQSEITTDKIDRTLISKLETGKRKMKYIIAKEISDRINHLISSKDLICSYTVTPELLMDKEALIIDEVLEELKENTNLETLSKVDRVIETTVIDSYLIIFIFRVLEVLQSKLNDNFQHIIDYAELLEFHNLTNQQRIELKMIKIIAFSSVAEYKQILNIGRSLIPIMKRSNDKEKKIRFFYHMAIAFMEDKQYDKANSMIKFARDMRMKKYECYLDIEQGNIYSFNGDYDKAIRIYKSLCNKIDDINILATINSSIAYAYLKKSNLKKAREYIQKGYKNIESLKTRAKFNVLSNDLLINTLNIDIDMLLLSLIELNSQADTEKTLRELALNVPSSKEETVFSLKKIKEYGFKISNDVIVEIQKKYMNNEELRVLLLSE